MFMNIISVNNVPINFIIFHLAILSKLSRPCLVRQTLSHLD